MSLKTRHPERFGRVELHRMRETERKKVLMQSLAMSKKKLKRDVDKRELSEGVNSLRRSTRR